VLLNLFADFEIRRVLGNLFLTESAGSPTFATIDSIAEQAELTLGYIGALGPVVPTIAWGIVSGSSHAVSHMVGVMSGQGIGTEVAGKGNMSLGVRSYTSDSFGAGTAMTSQADFRRKMLEGLQYTKSLNTLMPHFGGAEGLIKAGGQAGAVNRLESISGTAGRLAGAGGDVGALADLRTAQGLGEISGTIEAARERAGVKGGSWQEATAGNIQVQKLFEAAKKHRAGGGRRGVGGGTAGRNTQQGEIAKER